MIVKIRINKKKLFYNNSVTLKMNQTTKIKNSQIYKNNSSNLKAITNNINNKSLINHLKNFKYHLIK